MNTEPQTQFKRRSGYSSVPNAAMSDGNLSLEARGLLGYLFTFSQNWQFYQSFLLKNSGVGKDKYRRIIQELKDAGYLIITKKKDEKGRYIGAIWEVIDCPSGGPETRRTENPTFGKQDHIRDNNLVSDTSNKKILSKDSTKPPGENKIVEAWNEMTKGCGLAQCQKLTPSRAKKLKARIADYGACEITAAIQLIPTMPFLMGKNDRGWRVGFDFLLQPDSVVKILEGKYKSTEPKPVGRPTLSQSLMDDALAQDEPDNIWGDRFSDEVKLIEGKTNE